MLGVTELIGGGLVDRNGSSARRGIGLLAGMDLTGFETPVL